MHEYVFINVTFFNNHYKARWK